MKRLVLVWVVLTASPLPAQYRSAAAEPEPRSLRGYVSVPLQLTAHGRYLVVRAEAVGRPVSLIVDTGAPVSCLDLGTVKHLGLTTAPTVRQGGSAPVEQVVDLPGITIGSVRTKPIRVGVKDWADDCQFVKTVEGVRPDGLLGADVLEAYKAVIDYRSKTLYLYDPGAPDLGRMQGEWQGVKAALAGEPFGYPGVVRAARLTVRGTAYRYAAAGVVLTGVIQLSPATHTFTLSGVLLDGRPTPSGPGRLNGMYAFDGDELSLLWPGPDKPLDLKDFPKTPASTPENGMMHMRFERVPAEVAPPPRPVGQIPVLIPRADD